MKAIYRVEVDWLMDWSDLWKKERKNIKEYQDDENQYLTYIYEDSFENALDALKRIVALAGVEDPNFSIYKWKTKKNKTQRWTVTLNTKRTKEFYTDEKHNSEKRVVEERTKAWITEYELY